MNSITLTKEQLLQLQEFQHELLTQDNRATRDPIYGIMDYKWIYSKGEEHSDSEVLAMDMQGGDFSTYDVNQLVDVIKEFCYEEEIDTPECILPENLDIHAMIDFLNENDQEYEEYHRYKEYSLKHTASIFEKDSFEHLKYNKHHYSDTAHTYAISCWRMYRMENLMKLLRTVTFIEPWEVRFIRVQRKIRTLQKLYFQYQDYINKETEYYETIYDLSFLEVWFIQNNHIVQVSNKLYSELKYWKSISRTILKERFLNAKKLQ